MTSPPNTAGMNQIFSDPELLQMMQVGQLPLPPSLYLLHLLPSAQDPEVMAAFMDVQKNPENAKKYESNAKVKKVMEKLSATLGTGGMGGAAPRPSARPPPATSTSAKPSPSAATADMDLD